MDLDRFLDQLNATLDAQNAAFAGIRRGLDDADPDLLVQVDLDQVAPGVRTSSTSTPRGVRA